MWKYDASEKRDWRAAEDGAPTAAARNSWRFETLFLFRKGENTVGERTSAPALRTHLSLWNPEKGEASLLAFWKRIYIEKRR